MSLPLRHLPLLVLLFSQPLAIGGGSSSEMNRQLASTRAVKELALSPDGQTLVAAITDTTASGGHTHLWLLSRAPNERALSRAATDSAPSRTPAARPPSRAAIERVPLNLGKHQQITGTAGDDQAADDSNPVWSPAGQTILFRRKQGDTSTLNTLDVTTGHIDTVPVSNKPVSVKGFAVAPSGAIAAWAADIANDAANKAPKGDDHHVFDQTEQVRLYLESREQALPDNVRSVTWSKDSRSLLVVTEPTSDDLGALNHLWLIEDNKPPREIHSTAENVQSASWLPDGRIAYFARCARNAPIVCRDLFVQALDGDGPSKPINLTDTIDGSLITGADGSTTTGPLVTASGDILVTIARRFDQQMARIRVTDGRVTYINSLPAVVKAVATNANQNAFALLAAERGGVTSIQLADARLRSYVPLATPELQPAAWKPLQARRLEWMSDNHTIDALLYMPSGATPEKRVPLVVDVHGGPAGRFEDIDYPLVRLLLEEGWAVLHVNPRGSFGYGIEFLASLQDDLGGGDYRDIMTGVDAALAQAPIDKERLALIGFSYGGTIASFAVGRTTRFKALVAAAPVVNQISEYGTEGSSWYDHWYFGKPWTRLDAAWRQSPLADVAGARTPLLLFHGESDTVNPLGQSLELYRALRQEGAPVELILFPREGHRELGQNYFGYPSTEPYHGIALRQRMLDFLCEAFSGRPHAGLTMGDRP